MAPVHGVQIHHVCLSLYIYLQKCGMQSCALALTAAHSSLLLTTMAFVRRIDAISEFRRDEF